MLHINEWNMAKFEQDMAKEVSNRKKLSTLTKSQEILCNQIFDQFFIFGIPPNGDAKSTPKPLLVYPPFDQPSVPLTRVIQMALPNGSVNDAVSRNNVFIGIFNYIVQDEFVFQYVSGDQKIFGICIHVQSKKGQIPFFASKNTRKFTFAFCLISKFPIFSTHLTFISYLANLSVGKVGVSYPLKDKVPITLKMGMPIEGLDLTRHIGHHPLVEVPEFFENEIERYYSLSLDSSSILLDKGFELNFPPPSTSDNKLILCAALDILFSILSVSDVISLISALLLDAQVLVVGSSLQEVTMTVFALEYLLQPFSYSGIVMPILPTTESYVDLLHTPTPFLFGVTPFPKLKKIQFMESTYFVNLDKRSVPTVNFYPPFPDYNNVVYKVLAQLSVKNSKPNPYRFTSSCSPFIKNIKASLSMEAIEEILTAIHSPFSQHILSDVLTCFFVTDAAAQVTIFNQELFLASVDQNDLPFYEFLMESQTFQDYIEKQLDQFTLKKQKEEGGIRIKSSFSGNIQLTRKRSLSLRTKNFNFNEAE